MEQLRLDRYAEWNMRRRRADLPELPVEEFWAIDRRRSLRQRLLAEVAGRSLGYYRYGGSLLAEGRPLGILWLALSAALYPPIPIKRVREQAVLPIAWSYVRRLACAPVPPGGLRGLTHRATRTEPRASILRPRGPTRHAPSELRRSP